MSIFGTMRKGWQPKPCPTFRPVATYELRWLSG
jgi:hypothetical protein